MRNNQCDNCYYFDSCACGALCENYTPLVDDYDNISEFIEAGREEYRTAWFDYIKDFD